MAIGHSKVVPLPAFMVRNSIVSEMLEAERMLRYEEGALPLTHTN